MSIQRTCGRCGASVSPSAPEGLCIQCLLDGASDEEPSSGEHDPRGVAGPALVRFGDYELLEEIARGGMGVVYKAWQISLQRIVAVKMILSGHLASKQIAQRFKAEAIAAAVLRHPNIVSVHEVGVHEGQHFFSMEYVEGQNLAQHIGNTPLAPPHAARYTMQIAEAIHYAHEQGILHRDLKPSNILIEAASDQPRVTDFGLAKRLAGESSLTVSGQVLGSPNFMPPEQAGGRSGSVGRPSDVYGLGGILYFLLTARAPYQGETLQATVHQALYGEPIAPRLLNPGVPRDLETICLKCLEKEPAKRYSTAQELRNELNRFLNDKPIHARPVSRVERVWRWCRRKPALALSLCVIGILCLIVTLGAPVAVFRMNRLRLAAEAGQETARQERYVSDMSLAWHAWDEGNVKQAVALLNEHIPAAGQTDLRGFEWRLLSKLFQAESLVTLPFDSNGGAPMLATTPAHGFVAGAGKNTIRFLDPASGKELARFAYPNVATRPSRPLLALAAGRTNLLAAKCGDGAIGLWDLARRELQSVFQPFTNDLSCLALSPDGGTLAAVDRDQRGYYSTQLGVWDITAGAQVPRRIWGHPITEGIPAMNFSPDGAVLATASGQNNQTVILTWDAKSGAELAPILNASAAYIRALAFSPDGSLLASSGGGGVIKVWNFPERTLRVAFGGHASDLNSLVFTPDGRQLISAADDGTIRRWDLHSQKQSGVWRTPQLGEKSVAVAPDGKHLLSGGRDGLTLWNSEPRQPAASFQVTPGWSWQIVSPDCKRLVVSGLVDSGRSQGAAVWDLASGQHQFDLSPEGMQTQDMAFSPDGRLFALSSIEKSGIIAVWETAAWDNGPARLKPFVYLTNGFESASLAFSPDGTILGAAGLSFPPFQPKDPSGATNRLAFWKVGSWERLNILSHAGDGATEWAAAATLAFSPDGKLLAVGSRDGWVRFWDLKTETLLHESKQPGEAGWGMIVAFSPDSRWLAAHGRPGSSLVLFDLSDPKKVHSAPLTSNEPGTVFWTVFDPEIKTLIVAEGAGLIKFWNLRTRRVSLTLRHGFGPGGFLSLAPDGNSLVSKDARGIVKVWSAAPASQIPRFRSANAPQFAK